MGDFCTDKGGNTGMPKCDLNDIVIIGVVPCPRNAVIPAGTSDLTAFLKKQFKAVRNERFYPLIDEINTTNNSEEAVIATLANGFSRKLRDGNAIYQFDFPFSLCKAKTIMQFDGWNGGVFLISTDGRIVGRRQRNGDIAALIPKSIYTQSGFLGDGQNIQVASIVVNFGDSAQLLKKVDVTDKMQDFDTDELNGLIDLQLVVVGQAAGTVDIAVKTNCDNVNLFDTYTEKLSTVATWKATDKTTGADAVITTIAPQPASKSFRLSLAAGTYVLSLVDTAALETAGIEGFESVPVTVTIQ